MNWERWTDAMVATATAGILGGERYKVVAAAVTAVAGRPISDAMVENFARRQGLRSPRGRGLPAAWAAEAEAIVAAVAAAHGFSPEALMGPLGRGKCAGALTAARWAAIVALRDRTRLSLLDMARAMRLDKETIRNALDRTDAARAAELAADTERTARVAALQAGVAGIRAAVAEAHGLAPEAVTDAPDTAGRRARVSLCARLADEMQLSADAIADATGLPAPLVRAILRRLLDQRRIMAEMQSGRRPAPPPPQGNFPGTPRAMLAFGRFDVSPKAPRPDCRPDPRQWWADSMPLRGPLGWQARTGAAA